MRVILGALRSFAGLAAAVAWFAVPGWPWLHLYIVPLAWARPERRVALVSRYMKGIVAGLFRCVQLGGARFRTTGSLPTARPILILMNHQSLLDILTATRLSEGPVPAFVTRIRYARFVPLVSRCVQLLGSPVIDPRAARVSAVTAIERVARTTDRPILIFPEGHRTPDGEIRPFKSAGAVAVLRARPSPVYLVVTDGLWVSRRFVDFAFNLPRVRGTTDVLGPFDPPAAEAELPAFVESLRGIMVAHLHRMRERRDVAA